MLRLTSILVVIALTGIISSANALEVPDWLRDRVSVGARVTHFTFTDNKERIFSENGEFIGGFTEGISIDELDEIQNHDPLLYGRYHFSDYIALEVAQERMRGDALSYYGHTDGELVIDGFSLQLMGSYPNSTIFTPYIGVGAALLFAEFDHAPWGYGVHIIDTESETVGLLASAGCSISVWNRLSIDVDLRYLEASVDSHFNFVPNASHYYWEFPLDSWAAQVGAKWTF